MASKVPGAGAPTELVLPRRDAASAEQKARSSATSVPVDDRINSLRGRIFKARIDQTADVVEAKSHERIPTTSPNLSFGKRSNLQ